MQFHAPVARPESYLSRHQPDMAVMFFAPARLQATVRRFMAGFPGYVSYAVKANAGEEVLENLVAAGLRAFDVASPREMEAVRAACPEAVLHYNNPVRSHAEVARAVAAGVDSYAVDSLDELDKLAPIGAGREVAVRLSLGIGGGAYDFGAKFGAPPEAADALLREVAARGYRVAMTFHPGTQCADPAAWESYIRACAEIAARAGVTLGRLNVGGGFPAHRDGAAPDLEAIFARIGAAVTRHFAEPPALVCEPGRAMVADAFSLATRIKAVRGDAAVFLNDGIYGGLAEMRDIAAPGRLRVLAANGTPRRGALRGRVVFGPTCDSVDRLPGLVDLPEDCGQGDFVIFDGLGAYSLSIATRFNGYGPGEVVTVAELGGD